MTALADSLAAARQQADASLKLARSVIDDPAPLADVPYDVQYLANSVAALATAVLALADYAETPF